MSKKSAKFISVFIPTYNGEQYLGECLEALINQELPDGYEIEILVTDSGSKDKTLEIVDAYKEHVTLDIIPNSEFGHGKTRDQAARNAKGEFILFLTQDATPASYRWIINMIEPFFISEKIGCVFGRQIPRRHIAPTIKREVATAFGGLTAPDSIAIHRNKSLVDQAETNGLNTFFSDVNSAARRELLTGEVPFRDLPYAEDQALAEDMQNKGYLKAYAPAGAVWHSNEYTAVEYYKRKFDEYIGLQKSIKHHLPPSKKSLLLGWIRPTIEDYKFLRRDPDYSPKQKLKWLILTPVYNFNLQRGKYLASKHFDDTDYLKKHSLEESRK
jgi:rhamnosyltransferase